MTNKPKLVDGLDLSSAEVVELPSHLAKTVELFELDAKAAIVRRDQLAANRKDKRVHRAAFPLTQEFIAWDGEGYTPWPTEKPVRTLKNGREICVPKGQAQNHIAQNYILLACSTGEYIKVGRKEDRLNTDQIFEFLWRVFKANPGAIHVGFSIKYDVNQFFRDIPIKKLRRLFQNRWITHSMYRICYHAGKKLRISKQDDVGCLTIYDIFGFFQCSFVDAIEQFIGKDDPELVEIREGKSQRNEFEFEKLDSMILPYCMAELRMMVRLVESLRDRLNEAGLRIKSYHGAGAVANAIYDRHEIRKYMDPNIATDWPEVNIAAQYAYAGGRFEQFRCGLSQGRVYEYDIRSAYPSVMGLLPVLSGGRWISSKRFIPGTFSVWKIAYCGSEGDNNPQPLFRRTRTGGVTYPTKVKGWYWCPEAELVPDCVEEGWIFEPATDYKPFHFVEEMYEIRRQWKEQGINTQLAYKLGLNSLYGKMAQRIGAEYRDGKWRIPKYHQLEWAGYVTSRTRANLYRILATNPSDIVATETDAIFSRTPLDISVGKSLGQWELSTFDQLLYIQNGLYFGLEGNSIHTQRYRGLDKISLSFPYVIERLAEFDEKRKNGTMDQVPIPSLSGTTSRFVGFGIADRTQSTWCAWEKNKIRRIELGGGGKRCHSYYTCPQCQEGRPIIGGGFHAVQLNDVGGESFPHHLPWRPLNTVNKDRRNWEEEKFYASF